MRILFLQITTDRAVEYSIQAMLAERADPTVVDGYFVWQDPTHDPSLRRDPVENRPNGDTYLDFGRNLSLWPKPSRGRRALMMFTRAPISLIALFKLARSVKPDVIYTSAQVVDIYVGRLISMVRRVPHVVHLHYPVGPWLGPLVVPMLRRTDSLLACSEFVRRTAMSEGISGDSVEVVYNPVDVARYSEPADRAYVQAEFSLPDAARVVLSAGRLDPSKGHLLLLDAMAIVVREEPNARLVICGETFTRDAFDKVLKQHASDLGLEKHVVFAGHRSDMPKLMAGADIFSLPTVDEAFGLVFAEAMTSKLPVVALESGAVPEIVVDGVTGLLSPPDDVAGLAANLVHLLRDPARSREMGLRGREKAIRAYDRDAITSDWERLIKNLAIRLEIR